MALRDNFSRMNYDFKTSTGHVWVRHNDWENIDMRWMEVMAFFVAIDPAVDFIRVYFPDWHKMLISRRSGEWDCDVVRDSMGSGENV